jgi:predicted MFS family arabinose efflux permease
MGWRSAILIVGLLGLPVVAAIASQSRILVDKAPRDESPRAASVPRSTLLSLPMLLFFAFFTLGAMAQAGVQSWLITVLQTVNGVSLEIASAALTGFVGGTVLGVAIGGWLADHSHDRQLLYAGVMIAFSALLMLGVGILPMPSIAILVLISASGVAFGASRVSRDILVKNAAPPGEIGKVFGFVSAGLPFGQALTPVPFGFLIDRGHAEWILVLAAVILLLSLLCGGSASLGERNRLSAEA